MTTERRIQASPELRIERRNDTGAPTATPYLIGYASVFNEWTTLYESSSWVSARDHPTGCLRRGDRRAAGRAGAPEP